MAGHSCTGATSVVWCGNCVCVQCAIQIFYGFLVFVFACGRWIETFLCVFSEPFRIDLAQERIHFYWIVRNQQELQTCAMNHIRKAIMGHSTSHHGHLPCALHWRFIAVGIVCSCFSWFRSWTGSTTCLPRLWKAQQRHASAVVNFFRWHAMQ